MSLMNHTLYMKMSINGKIALDSRDTANELLKQIIQQIANCELGGNVSTIKIEMSAKPVANFTLNEEDRWMESLTEISRMNNGGTIPQLSDQTMEGFPDINLEEYVELRESDPIFERMMAFKNRPFDFSGVESESIKSNFKSKYENTKFYKLGERFNN